MSSSTGAARASSNGSSPQPDLSAVELAEENASLRAQLAFSEEEKSALKGELDAARAQHELDATVNTFLEGVASETVVVVDELIDRFRRARPPPLKDATNAQEMTNVEPDSSLATPLPVEQVTPGPMTLRVPWDVFELIIKSASSTALALFARTCHDIAEIALEELARRPHLFDLRNDDSGIESFFGSRDPKERRGRVPDLLRHHRKYRHITLAISNWNSHSWSDPSADRCGSRADKDCFVAVETLVVDIVDTERLSEEYEPRPEEARFELTRLQEVYYSSSELGKILAVFKPDVFHTHGDMRGLYPSSVDSSDIPMLEFDDDEAMPKFEHYRTATAVWSGCLPSGFSRADQNGLYGWVLYSNGDVVWNPFPAKVIFVIGGANRNGIAWEYVDARDDEHFNPADPGWIRELLKLPQSIGLVKPFGNQMLQRPVQRFEVELWVDEHAVRHYQTAFDTTPLFATMATVRDEAIRWTAVSLQEKKASTMQWEADVVKGLGGIDRD